MKQLACVLLLAAMTWAVASARPPVSSGTGRSGTEPGGVLLLDIEGGIGPATRDYVRRGLALASRSNARAVVLRIDTPGGLDAATRDINPATLSSEVPVIGWVAPQGERAASAGTYILYACHLAAMAPATSVGAATPVAIGGAAPGAPPRGQDAPRERREAPGGQQTPEQNAPRDGGRDARTTEGPPGERAPSTQQPPTPEPGTTMDRKAINDAVGYLRSLGELRGRNVEFAEAAVRSAATLTASQALAQGVIEIMAADLPALLRAANGREVRVGQRVLKLSLPSNAVVTNFQPDWRAKLLGVLTEPTVAYLLLLIGLYGLVIEAYSPGALFPGIAGAISLLLALYALQILPVSYAGVALIVLAVGLMAAEFAMPSFGALGIGGLVALVAGSLIMFDTDVPGFGLPGQLIIGLAAASSLVFMGTIWLAARTRKRPVVTGMEELIGHVAVATADFEGRGQVQIRGEVWQAASKMPVRRRTVRTSGCHGWTGTAGYPGRPVTPAG